MPSHIFPSLLYVAHNYPQNSPTIMTYTRLQGLDHQRSYGLNQGVCPRIKIPGHSHKQQPSASLISPNRGSQIIKEMETEASAPQNKSESPTPIMTKNKAKVYSSVEPVGRACRISSKKNSAIETFTSLPNSKRAEEGEVMVVCK